MPNLHKITSLLFLCNIFRKKWVIKLIFLQMQISMKVSYKLILWFLMQLVKHSQSSQNSKFPMPLQYIKKEVRNEVYFLLADKNQSLLQFDFNTLGIKVSCKVILSLLKGMIKHSQSNRFAISLQCLKKEVRDGVHFLDADIHQRFYKLE